MLHPQRAKPFTKREKGLSQKKIGYAKREEAHSCKESLDPFRVYACANSERGFAKKEKPPAKRERGFPKKETGNFFRGTCLSLCAIRPAR
jgi:hypothetical protein